MAIIRSDELLRGPDLAQGLGAVADVLRTSSVFVLVLTLVPQPAADVGHESGLLPNPKR